MNRRKLRAVWALYRKDIRYSLLIAFLVIFVYTTWGLPINVAAGWFALSNVDMPDVFNDPDENRYEYTSYDEIYGGTDGESESYFGDGMEDMIHPIPGFHGASPLVMMIPMFLIQLILIFVIFEGFNYIRETSTGTIRTLMKYRVNMKDIMISKMGSTLTIFLVFVGFALAMGLTFLLVFDIFVKEVIILSAGLTLFIIGNYVFFYSLSAILMYFRVKEKFVKPVVLMVVGNLFLLLITETVICVITLILSEMNRTVYARPGIANLMYLSPFHLLGRFFNYVLLGDPFYVMDFVWVPIFIGVLVAGYILGRKVYPDIFIGETA